MKNKITIILVSYFSSKHIKRLVKNLVEKAENSERLNFLIVDNTNGQDRLIERYAQKYDNMDFLLNDGANKQRSISHASAIDKGLENSHSEYTLIIDPDVYIFKKKWDTFCIKSYSEKNFFLIGAPYPEWKIGKVHDFPSVVFMFFSTKEMKKLNTTFYPFPDFWIKLKNSFIRKVIRLGFFGSKGSLNKFHFFRKIATYLENLTGITSPDTGNNIINAMRNGNKTSLCFEARYSSDINDNDGMSILAKEYEAYMFQDELIMTHMYGSGVFYWKTSRGGDVDYWEKIINKIEKNR